mmetsp:Transcript_62623/g.104223  ORF Transcript_62623/g.104223 Transcript_62623/m.104223 type:complete len:244 (-) Transcript_62623:116-847(-)
MSLSGTSTTAVLSPVCAICCFDELARRNLLARFIAVSCEDTGFGDAEGVVDCAGLASPSKRSVLNELLGGRVTLSSACDANWMLSSAPTNTWIGFVTETISVPCAALPTSLPGSLATSLRLGLDLAVPGPTVLSTSLPHVLRPALLADDGFLDLLTSLCSGVVPIRALRFTMTFSLYIARCLAGGNSSGRKARNSCASASRFSSFPALAVLPSRLYSKSACLRTCILVCWSHVFIARRSLIRR